MAKGPTVEAWLKAQPADIRSMVERLRALVPRAGAEVTEHIKWNGPSFCIDGDDRITMGVAPKGGVRVVLHRGVKTKDAADVRGYAKRRFQRLVVPFAMPLLIGPGAISTIIIQAGEAQKIGPAGTVAGLTAIGAAGVATFLIFALTGPISRLLGDVGMTIVVRVLGLILCAMAVQFILSGFSDATRGFIRHDAAAPYEKAH